MGRLGIPEGSPNGQNAQRFIEFFITSADRQAPFAQLMPCGPANRNEVNLYQKLGRKFASHPDYLASSIQHDSKWHAEMGSDGVTNVERLTQRWNE
ncbi:hypothetical protein CK218_15255 [Mesorhizobium sp. WSM3879]|nr:hypothetical protein CK218_15255 [Mesorhizobium sp. WSM3879]